MAFAPHRPGSDFAQKSEAFLGSLAWDRPAPSSAAR
jgi:hypothetical protein